MPDQRINELSDPVTKEQAAVILHVGIASIYDSMHQYDAARILGDEKAMSRHIPCIHSGGVERPNGTFKGGRYTMPRDAFVRWYTTAGSPGSIDSVPGGDPDVPTAGVDAKVEVVRAHDLVINIRLVLEDGVLRALADTE